MTKTFEAQIADWADLTFEQIQEVHQDATFGMMTEMQTPKPQGGRMPVDTGNLRNSLVSGLNGSFGPESDASFALVTDAMTLDDVARFGYTAEYAQRMEFGFTGEDSLGRSYNQSGNFFATTAAAGWPARVESLARAKAR